MEKKNDSFQLVQISELFHFFPTDQDYIKNWFSKISTNRDLADTLYTYRQISQVGNLAMCAAATMLWLILDSFFNCTMYLNSSNNNPGKMNTKN